MRIMIGYDGSEHSDAAIDSLRWAGIPRDSEFLIVSVGDLLMSAPELSEAIDKALYVPRVSAALKKEVNRLEKLAEERLRKTAR